MQRLGLNEREEEEKEEGGTPGHHHHHHHLAHHHHRHIPTFIIMWEYDWGEFDCHHHQSDVIINDDSEVKAETGRYTEFEERYLLPALQVDLLLHI